eukprot:g14274.t1
MRTGNLLKSSWLLAGIAALAKAQSACPVGVSSLLVSSPEEALELGKALNCSGPGQFEVDWIGEVLISSTIEVSDDISLMVTGSLLGADAPIINGSGDPGVQLFTLGDRAELELNSVSLVDGFGFGAAVSAGEGSRLVARDCSFVGNTNCAILASGADVGFEGTTEFTDNLAFDNGGAVYVIGDSVVSFEGETVFTGNEAMSYGGAVAARDGSVASFAGETVFFANFASAYGGAVWVADASVAFTGETEFTNNVADTALGGAVFSDAGNTSFEGVTMFTGNTANTQAGGAVALWDGGISFEGRAVFNANNATSDNGGALYVSRGASLVMDAADVSFTSNAAGGSGGAVYIDDVNFATENGSSITFTNNTAAANGGALAAANGASLTIRGPLTFTNNTARGDGGGVFVTGSAITTGQGVTFTDNTAINGAGGGMYCSIAVASINDLVFTENNAIWGGGLALFSTGTLWTKDEDDSGSLNTSGSANTTKCIFERNRAIDGGGIYSSAGYDIVQDVWFEGNVAEGSGGAYIHSGVLVRMGGSTFVENKAGDEGPAVLSLGIAENISGITFDANTFYCSAGQYGYEEERTVDGEDSGNCRFNVVCSRCTESCASADSGINVLQDSFEPTCQLNPTGIKNSEEMGATLQTLELESGYYRTSNVSRSILECYREEACTGGSDPNEYCAAGYQGPYCAVCEEGYGSGYQYSCKDCFGEDRRATIVHIGALTYTVASSRNSHSPDGLRAATGKHLSLALFVMFIVYSSVSYIVFQTYVCETLDDGITYLRADYSLTCTTSVHTAWEVYAGIMIIVYPVGIPVVFAWWLVPNRHAIAKASAGRDDGSDPPGGPAEEDLEQQRLGDRMDAALEQRMNKMMGLLSGRIESLLASALRGEERRESGGGGSSTAGGNQMGGAAVQLGTPSGGNHMGAPGAETGAPSEAGMSSTPGRPPTAVGPEESQEGSLGVGGLDSSGGKHEGILTCPSERTSCVPLPCLS